MPSPQPVNDTDLSRFNEDGFVIIRGLFEPDRDFAPVVAEYETVLSGLVDHWIAQGHLDHAHAGLPFTQRLGNRCF